MLAAPIEAAFWMSMKVSARIVLDKVSKCEASIRSATMASGSNGKLNPSSKEEWELVVREATELIKVALPMLSLEWGAGVLVMVASCWAFALAAFVSAVQGFTFYAAAIVPVCASIPIFLANDVAQVSTDCTKLLRALHDKRVNFTSDGSHLGILKLEVLIRQCNGNQGLGFVVLGRIVDKQMLKTIFLTIVSTSVTAFPLIVSLRHGAAASPGLSPCGLSNVQRNTIQALMEERNKTCAFNMTLDSILAAN